MKTNSKKCLYEKMNEKKCPHYKKGRCDNGLFICQTFDNYFSRVK